MASRGTKIHSPDSGADYPCSPIGNPGCPSVDRYFFVDGDPKQILDGAEKSVVAAGFTVTLELRAACDGGPNGPLGLSRDEGQRHDLCFPLSPAV
jgi:hypothetical protein